MQIKTNSKNVCHFSFRLSFTKNLQQVMLEIIEQRQSNISFFWYFLLRGLKIRHGDPISKNQEIEYIRRLILIHQEDFIHYNNNIKTITKWVLFSLA